MLELAKKIEKKKDEELNNQEEIKSRQALKMDLEKYLSDSEITRYITWNVYRHGYRVGCWSSYR